MKLEVDIPIEQIQAIAQKQVAHAIAQLTDSYGGGEYISAQIKVQWRAAVDNAILVQLADSDAIKTAIRAGIEKKLKAQIAPPKDPLRRVF